MTRKKILFVGLAASGILYLLQPTLIKGLLSIPLSYILPVDDKYIIEEGEWIGDVSGSFRLDNKTDSLADHIVYCEGKPTYKIRRLNKYFNELDAEAFDSKDLLTFTSSREFTK